jgi:hypothetical protein
MCAVRGCRIQPLATDGHSLQLGLEADRDGLFG